MAELNVIIRKDGSTTPSVFSVSKDDLVHFSTSYDAVICFKTKVFNAEKLVIPSNESLTVQVTQKVNQAQVGLHVIMDNLEAKCVDESVSDDPDGGMDGD